MSEDLVLRFNENDYIEYVIKERFKRDYWLKNLVDREKESNIGDQTVFNIKLKTKQDGVLLSVLGQTKHIILMVCMICVYYAYMMNFTVFNIYTVKILFS